MWNDFGEFVVITCLINSLLDKIKRGLVYRNNWQFPFFEF